MSVLDRWPQRLGQTYICFSWLWESFRSNILHRCKRISYLSWTQISVFHCFLLEWKKDLELEGLRRNYLQLLQGKCRPCLCLCLDLRSQWSSHFMEDLSTWLSNALLKRHEDMRSLVRKEKNNVWYGGKYGNHYHTGIIELRDRTPDTWLNLKWTFVVAEEGRPIEPYCRLAHIQNEPNKDTHYVATFLYDPLIEICM